MSGFARQQYALARTEERRRQGKWTMFCRLWAMFDRTSWLVR